MKKYKESIKEFNDTIMRKSLFQILFELLRFEICETELSCNIKNEMTTDVLQGLYQLSKMHDIGHLIADALDKNGLLDKNTETGKAFFKQRALSLYRYEQLRFELEKLYEILEKNQIPFIPLKGSILRNLYPKPWMRTSCDIDILVKEKDLDKAVNILTNEYAYENRGRGYHDISLFSPTGVHVELHFNLVEDGRSKNAKQILNSVWDLSIERQENYFYFYKMPAEMFYFYHIAHMAKHFEVGGCGIRSFLDLWIFNLKMSTFELTKSKFLEEGHLLTFAKACENLSQVWFEVKPHNETTLKLERYIISGGAYGNTENRVVVQRSKKNNKFKYILSRLFLPYNLLKDKYPRLNGRKWLTPFYQIRRWLEFIFLKKDKNLTIGELKSNQKVTKEQVSQIQQLLDELDLIE